jgi:large subunit ribosomal protein L30
MAGKLRVTLIKSEISHTRETRATVRALGLHRIGETVEIDDTPPLRGMTRRVRFLLRTEEVGDDAAATTATRAPRKKKEESKP